MAHQLGDAGIGLDQARRELVGVAGGVAQALDARDVGNVFQQQREVGDLGAVAHLAAVGVDVLAQQRDFLDALVGQTGDLDQHVVKRPADLFAARVRHDAVAAVLGAAFHDADEGRGALDLGRWQVVELFDFGKADVNLRAPLACAGRQQFGEAVQGLRAEHQVHIGRALDDGRTLLAGDAAANANLHALAFQVLDAAQVAEDLLLCLLAHRAGVEQDQVGLVNVLRQLVAFGRVQHVQHLVRVVLVHLAAKGLDEYFLRHGGFQGIRFVKRGARNRGGSEGAAALSGFAEIWAGG